MGAEDLSRYARMASELAAPALRTAHVPRLAVDSVLMAVPAARLLLADEPDQHRPLAEGLKRLALLGREAVGPAPEAGTWAVTPGRSIVLVDPAGHGRDVYHPLVLHLHLAAFRKRFESLPPKLWSACEDALADALLPVRRVESFADAAPPPEMTDLVLWLALCLLEGSMLSARDVDAEVVDSAVHRVVARPGDDGSLQPRSAEESLDAWTYRELCGLHALANLAVLRRNRDWARRVEEVALYHLRNSQPDNATNQPWALAAFLWSPKTRSLGEQQLHDVAAHGPAGGDAGAVQGIQGVRGALADAAQAGVGGTEPSRVNDVAALLLADAANTLGAFESAGGDAGNRA